MNNEQKTYTLRGVIERITFHNEENGYTVAKLLPERRPSHLYGRDREVPIIGNMAGVNVGESVELSGRWTVHAEYGKQFIVAQMRTVLPATVAGLEKYLGSGLIKGVGPVTAKRIVKQFGTETLEIIENEPSRLIEAAGVGRKRVMMIIKAWAEQRAIKEVMLFLQSHGVSTSLATKIYKYYGDESIAVVKEDPYRLAQDIYGIGFLTADKIAQSMGISPDSPQRVAAGIAYALNQATDQGHVYLPTAELIKEATKLLEVSAKQIGAGLIRLWGNEQIKLTDTPGGDALDIHQSHAPSRPVVDGIPQLLAEPGALYSAATVDQAQQLLAEDQAIYLTPFYYSEQGVTNRIRRLLSEGDGPFAYFQYQNFDWAKAFKEIEKQGQLRLAPQQQEAVKAALTHRVTVITGGPGTGKTTLVNIILKFCSQVGQPALLAAPTGRAAKRLAETTGQEAKTLHRLLEFSPTEGMSFKRNESSPLEGALLIVDEASMLDLVLTNHLLKAVPPGMHLLFVGDVDQLPSVGAGNVLRDIIAAIEGQTTAEDSAFPKLLSTASVIRLQTIFRQEQGSYIITNAHRINEGKSPLIDNQATTDFFLFKTEEPERAAELCVELVKERIPRRFAIPSHDIQVLSPMHRGVVGVGAMNIALQNAINPAGENKGQRHMGNRVFRVGDRVMQMRNNYDKDVYNGDMGTITTVDMEMQKVTVVIDGNEVNYDFLELDELTHSYVVSIHKSQGSEFPAVVIPIVTSHYMMLQRNLLYTAVTRARRLVVLVGQPRAIGMAVRNNQVTARFTGLQERLERLL